MPEYSDEDLSPTENKIPNGVVVPDTNNLTVIEENGSNENNQDNHTFEKDKNCDNGNEGIDIKCENGLQTDNSTEVGIEITESINVTQVRQHIYIIVLCLLNYF